MSTERHWLSVHEVAQLLQVKDETVRRWIRRQELAVLDTGEPRSGYRIRREDLDHFIWQRYRMRNQDQQDRLHRVKFSNSEEHRVSRSPVVVQDDRSRYVSSHKHVDNRSTRASTDASQYLSLISRIPGITYVAFATGDGNDVPDRRIAFVSAEFEHMLDISAGDLRADSRRWWDLVHHEDLPVVREAQRDISRDGSRLSLEYRVLGRSSQVFWVHDEAVPSDDHASKRTMWQGIITNISERKQIEEALYAQATQQAAIAKLGQHALADLDIADLLDEAVRFVQTTLAVDLTKVLQLQPGGDSLVLVAGTGWEAGAVNRATVSAGAGSQAGYTLLSNEPVVVNDLASETRFSGPPLLHDYGVRSGISVIIAGTGMPWGVLGAHTTSLRTFTRQDLNFLQSVANILASAIRSSAPPGHDGRWLSVRNVAETLKINDETVRRWVRRGDLPAVDLVSSRAGYRIHPSDLDRFIAERYTGTGQLHQNREETGRELDDRGGR
jgi:excisionase family DNA binding protein/PAS domain S-box-containing protein